MQKKIVNENTPEQGDIPFYKTAKFKKLAISILIAVGSYFGIEIAAPGSIESVIESVISLI